MSYVSSKKYTGVQHRVNEDGSKVFYIRYKNRGKLIREKIGNSKEGVTEVFASNQRAKRVSEIRLGSDAPMVTKEDAKRKNNLTVYDAAKMYFESAEDLKDFANIKGRYFEHLHERFGNKLLAEVRTEDVKKMLKDKQKETSFKTGEKYANATINKMLEHLHTIYLYVIKKESLKLTSPVADVKRLPIDNARQRFLDEDEITMLYETIQARYKSESKSVRKTVTDDLMLFVALSLSTGGRVSTILNIRKRDIKLTSRTIVLKNTKTNKTYTGFISDRLYALLEPLMPTLTPLDYVIGRKKQPKSRTSINKALQPILDRLFNDGLEKRDFQNRTVLHTFRHTFGSLLAINGTPIFTIQKMMNHQDIKMTNRYAKLAPDSGLDAVRGLNV